MTSKLVVIINSFKVPKIKKILLYEMKFLVPNYSCLQNPWLGGLPPPDPRSLCPLSSTEFVQPPRRTKFLGTPLISTFTNDTELLIPRPRQNCLTYKWSYLCTGTNGSNEFIITLHSDLLLYTLSISSDSNTRKLPGYNFKNWARSQRLQLLTY